MEKPRLVNNLKDFIMAQYQAGSEGGSERGCDEGIGRGIEVSKGGGGDGSNFVQDEIYLMMDVMDEIMDEM